MGERMERRELVKWINNLIEIDRLYRFYKNSLWLRLKKEVEEEQHHECQKCKARGRYRRNDVVHHVKHVREHPELALSRYYIDEHGKKQKQLICLCNQCHNEEHPEKFGKLMRQNQKDKFTNEERW